MVALREPGLTTGSVPAPALGASTRPSLGLRSRIEPGVGRKGATISGVVLLHFYALGFFGAYVGTMVAIVFDTVAVPQTYRLEFAQAPGAAFTVFHPSVRSPAHP